MIDLTIFESTPASKRALSCRKSVCGIAVNDVKFTTCISVNGKTINHPAYDIWSAMINRCYSEKGRIKNPTYNDVTVCDEWLRFSAFFSWWKENHVDGYHMDKDLLTDSREYSPSTCVFVTRRINNFLLDSRAAKGDLPTGCSMRANNKKIRVRVGNPITGRRESLGDYSNEAEAMQAWVERKVEIANELKGEMDSIDLRIHPRVIELINRMR